MADSSGEVVGCPRCVESGPFHGDILWFAWDYGRSGDMTASDGRTIRVDPIRRVEGLRFGDLWRCETCGQEWWQPQHNDPNSGLYAIKPSRRDLLDKWNRDSLRPSRESYRLLRDIGGVLTEMYASVQRIIVPCAVTLSSGVREDFALFSFQSSPPIQGGRIALCSDVLDVRTSPFALPLSVRAESLHAQERSNGFAPTFVRAPNGRAMCLNWLNHFLDEPGVNAAEVTVAAADSSDLRAAPIARVESDRLIWVIADRVPEDDRLFH